MSDSLHLDWRVRIEPFVSFGTRSHVRMCFDEGPSSIDIKWCNLFPVLQLVLMQVKTKLGPVSTEYHNKVILNKDQIYIKIPLYTLFTIT